MGVVKEIGTCSVQWCCDRDRGVGVVFVHPLQYWELKEVALFLTAPNTLDPSLALGLYLQCGSSGWLYRGCVHNGHPSEVMPLQVYSLWLAAWRVLDCRVSLVERAGVLHAMHCWQLWHCQSVLNAHLPFLHRERSDSWVLMYIHAFPGGLVNPDRHGAA